MTTINCASNCTHQIEGKCTLDNISFTSISSNPDCVFFQEKTTRHNPAESPVD